MALAANTPRDLRNSRAVMLQSKVIKTGKVIFSGAIVTQIKATAGNPAEPATNDAAANVFCGIATGDGDIALSGDGTRSVKLFIANAEVRLPVEAAVTKGIIGQTVYAKDDGSVGTATTLGPPVGQLSQLDTVGDAGFGWVLLRVAPATANT